MAEHDGHRQRLIKKMYQEHLEEDELLEVMLFNAMPRRNTSDIAHRLMSIFGSILSIFASTKEELMQVEGVGESVAAYLYCLGEVFNRSFVDRYILSLPEHYEPNVFGEFLSKNFRETRIEMFDIYLLDSNGKVVDYCRYSSRKLDEVTMDSKDFAQVMRSKQATGMAVVHNHPNGFYGPSPADDDATVKILQWCRRYGVHLWDHMIVSRTGAYSYFTHGKFPYLRELAGVQTDDLDAEQTDA